MDFCVEFACSPCTCVGSFRVLLPSRNIHVIFIGDSKLILGVSVSVCGCLCRLSLCWPCDSSWDRLQLSLPSHNPELDYAGIENGWIIKWASLVHQYWHKEHQRLLKMPFVLKIFVTFKKLFFSFQLNIMVFCLPLSVRINKANVI